MANESLIEALRSELEAVSVQCTTQDGQTGYVLEVDRRHRTSGQRRTIGVNFIIPPGYIRQSFSHSVDARFSAGGSVNWANDDSHDGTIRLHGWVDAFGYVKVTVTNVTAVKEEG